jgi:hypothetical protein
MIKIEQKIRERKTERNRDNEESEQRTEEKKPRNKEIEKGGEQKLKAEEKMKTRKEVGRRRNIEKKRRIVVWNNRLPQQQCHREPPTLPTPSGQLPSSSASLQPPHQLHCFANEQWRVNYNSLSTVHVNNGESLFTGPDRCHPQTKMHWAGSGSVKKSKKFKKPFKKNCNFLTYFFTNFD